MLYIDGYGFCDECWAVKRFSFLVHLQDFPVGYCFQGKWLRNMNIILYVISFETGISLGSQDAQEVMLVSD